MKCKLFNCAYSDLENVINAWLIEASVLSVVKVVPIAMNNANVCACVLVFYTQKAHKVQVDYTDDQLPKCPKCTSTMKVRANQKNGSLFFGCIKYPECRGTRKFTDKDQVKFGGCLKIETSANELAASQPTYIPDVAVVAPNQAYMEDDIPF